MEEEIDWSTQFTCDVCHETFVKVPKPKISIEDFVQEEACYGCGHKQWYWNNL